VVDVEEASHAYALLLGAEPLPRRDGTLRFQLGIGAVELVPGVAAGPHAVRFAVADARARTLPESAHGLSLCVEGAADVPAPGGATDPTAVQAIDHVVVQTPDPDRAIALWRDGIGLRLALDRTFPERGLRLVFFRSGGITLEYAGAHPPAEDRDGADRFHGVSYRVGDLASHRERLARAGLDVSPLRPGMRPGTAVVTVRSGTAGVPTLLIEDRRPSVGATS
jgi:catechol 2,3-dioxygenase-like lactoylglutathione lyase family enzyme